MRCGADMQSKGSALWTLLAEVSIAWIALGIFAVLVAATLLGVQLQHIRLRMWKKQRGSEEEKTEYFLVSGTMLLLGLLVAFTFNLGLERYEERRRLVIDEANAIGTAYLRAQVLDEPYRTRLSRGLVAYTENRVALSDAEGNIAPLLARNDQLLTDLWASVIAANEAAKAKGISTAYYFAFNDVFNLDTERKAARQAKIPDAVMISLFVVLILSATMMGSALYGRPQQGRAAIFLMLLTLCFCLIIDLNRPTSGLIREPQGPLEQLHSSLLATPPSAFDRPP